MKRTIHAILILTVLIFSGTACKKKKTDTQQPEPEKGTMLMHLHAYVGSAAEVEKYDTAYTDDNKRKISLSIAQLYLSGFQFVKADDSSYSIPDTVILKTLDQESFTIGKVPAGNYTSVRFNVGLSPSVNAKNPSASLSDVLNHSEMWFGSAAQPEGYVFLNVQGKIDTTADASGSDAQMVPFAYRIGTNANLKQVSMPNQNYTVVANQAQYMHLYFDVSKLFRGITLSQQSNLTVSSVSDNAGSLAAKIRDNIQDMFSYEQQ